MIKSRKISIHRFIATTLFRVIKGRPQPKRNRNRQRKIVWYNPPWNANVKTNLGRKFLNIIDRCFPNGHPLHKIFNKHTLKLSYSCMPNMKSIISSHNKAVLSDYHQSQTQTSNKECNCRKKDQCPLDGKCLTQNVVYQATVTTQTSSESYVGLATNFKDRYRNHTASFRHESKRNETELSKTHLDTPRHQQTFQYQVENY